MVTGGITLFKRFFARFGKVAPPPSALLATRLATQMLANQGGRPERRFSKPVSADVGSFLGDMIYTGRSFMDAGPLNTVMGMFSGLSLLSGFWSYKQKTEDAKEAAYAKDKVGVVTAQLGRLEGFTRSLFGASFVGSFASGLYKNIQSLRKQQAPVPSLMNRIFLYTGLAGEGIEVISLAALGISSLVSMKEIADVGRKIHQDTGSMAGQAELVKHTFSFDTARWLCKKRQDRSFQQELEQKALKTLAKTLTEKSEEQVSKEEAYLVYRELFQDPSFANKYRKDLLQALKLDPKKMNDFSLLALFGLFEEVNQRELKKERQGKRLLNQETIKSIQKIKTMGLIERLKISAPLDIQKSAKIKFELLQSRINKDLLVSLASSLALFATAALGISICVMSILSLVGMVAAPPFFLVLLFIATIVLVDVTSLKKALYQGKPGTRDYILLGIQALVVLASFSMGIGIAIALHQASSALIKPALIAGSTLGLSAFSYYRLSKREKEWKKENPSLEEVYELLQEGEGQVPREISSMVKKLSKEDRVVLNQKLENRSLISKRDFGASFLQTFSHPEDYDRYVRGVKKGVKKCWKEYELKKSEQNYENAIVFQRLLDRLEEMEIQEAITTVQSMNRSQLRDLFFFVEKVFKKEESLKNLRRAIYEVLEERKRYKI